MEWAGYAMKGIGKLTVFAYEVYSILVTFLQSPREVSLANCFCI